MRLYVILSVSLILALIFIGCKKESSCPGITINVTTSKTDPTGTQNNGSITAIATGGDGFYTFSISGGTSNSTGIFNGLGAGAYTITATNADGCSGRSTLVVLAASCFLSQPALSGIYKVTAALYQLDSNAAPIDDYSTWDNCDKDQLYDFNSDSSYFAAYSPACGDTTFGSWTLNGDQLAISLSGGLSNKTYKVLDFSCNSFKTRYFNLTNEDIFIRTYTRQ